MVDPTPLDCSFKRGIEDVPRFQSCCSIVSVDTCASKSVLTRPYVDIDIKSEQSLFSSAEPSQTIDFIRFLFCRQRKYYK